MHLNRSVMWCFSNVNSTHGQAFLCVWAPGPGQRYFALLRSSSWPFEDSDMSFVFNSHHMCTFIVKVGVAVLGCLEIECVVCSFLCYLTDLLYTGFIQSNLGFKLRLLKDHFVRHHTNYVHISLTVGLSLTLSRT